MSGIGHSTVRRFDGGAGESLHTAIVPPGTGLRFVSLVTLLEASGAYATASEAPRVALAWVPRERISDEASSPAEIDAALASPDQIPLLISAGAPVLYRSDGGRAFPVVEINGAAMVLALRITKIPSGVHGQLTLGWEGVPSC